jgi:hypothetical protein
MATNTTYGSKQKNNSNTQIIYLIALCYIQGDTIEYGNID